MHTDESVMLAAVNGICISAHSTEPDVVANVTG